MRPRLGDPAPDFDARSDDGARVRLSELRGQWVVLYFFPRSGTPGCSLEARGFEAALPELRALGACVIGVSSDTEARAALMRERCALSFPLLPDSARAICRRYGVMGGLPGLFGLAARQTYLINPDGRVAQHWGVVQPLGHPQQVLDGLRRLTVQATGGRTA